MDADAKIDVILEALGDQAPVVIICAGVAWQCHLVKFSAYRVTAVARILGSSDVRGERSFHLDEIADIAIFAEPGEAEGSANKDLTEIAQELLALSARPQITTRAELDRALRNAAAKLRGQEDGSQHHGPTSDGGVDWRSGYTGRLPCGACNGRGYLDAPGQLRAVVQCRACGGDGLSRR